MKKIVMMFMLLALIGCKKCAEYDENLSYRRIFTGKRTIITVYHKCLKYEEEK